MITFMGRHRVDWENERPGFIDADRQDGRGVLVFQVGILPSNEYRINRRGEVVERRAV